MIKAIIVDDEPAMQQINQRFLESFFPTIELVGIADSVVSGVNLITEYRPQLVLLDVEIKGGSGFEILQRLKPYDFKVVFITGFDSYALKAIKFSALDYLLKPVVDFEFQAAIQKAVLAIQHHDNQQLQTQTLLESIRKEMQPKKLVLKTNTSIHLTDVDTILYCQSDNSYTTFFLDSNESITVSKSLKEYDDLLKEFAFFRPHQSYLVNIHHILKVDKTDGGFLIMKNKKEIPISVRQKKKLISLLSNL